jgi:hypothetical protein
MFSTGTFDMKIALTDPPREFEVGFEHKVRIVDSAHIELDPNEQVTFTTQSGTEFDVVKKAWGYYATPSLNSRLVRFGLSPILVRNRLQHYFVVLLENGKETEFDRYVQLEGLERIANLADAEQLHRIAGAMLHTE